MINYVILVCVTMLSFTMLMAGFRAQNALKYEDSDKMRSGLFLQYDVFKRNTLFIIKGVLVVLFVQLMGILFSIQDIYQVHRQMMLIASVVSLFMVGFILTHLNNVVSFTEPDSANNASEWRAWLE